MGLLEIESILTDWQTGKHLPSSFKASVARPVYYEHLKMMHILSSKNKAGFFTMLSKIYSKAR